VSRLHDATDWDGQIACDKNHQAKAVQTDKEIAHADDERPQAGGGSPHLTQLRVEIGNSLQN